MRIGLFCRLTGSFPALSYQQRRYLHETIQKPGHRRDPEQGIQPDPDYSASIDAAYMALSTYHSNMLTRLATDSGEKQQASIEQITDSVMDSVVEQSMGRATALQAYIADQLFDGLKGRVQMLGDYAEKLFASPSAYPRMAFAMPDQAKNGQMVTQLILADGVSASDPALADRLGLAANLSDMMVSLFGASAGTNSCFIALPEGAFLVTDDRSATKFTEAGSYVSYDPRSRPWYQQAAEKGELIFTDVEIDAFTGDIGIVCAMPVYADGQLTAVVGSDLFLTSMQEYVQASTGTGNYICVINRNGHVVFSPQKEGVFRVLPANEAQDLRKSENKALAALIANSLQEKTPMQLIDVDGESYFILGVPMETVGWSVISVCSQEVVGQPAAMLLQSYDQIQEDASAAYLENTGHSRTTATVLLLGIAFLMLLGGLLGVGLAALLLFPFSGLIESALNLPYLMPDTRKTLLLAAGTVLLSVTVAALSSVMAAYRLSRIDPGTVLREGN